MSPLIETLAKIDDAGGNVLVRDGAVRIKAPAGVLSDQDRSVLSSHKADILAMLSPVDTDTTPPSTGKTKVVSTSAVSPEFVDQDLNQWLRENTIEAIPCDDCGGLERWEDLRGGWHCSFCQPRHRAEMLRLQAQQIRRKVGSSGRGPLRCNSRRPASPRDS